MEKKKLASPIVGANGDDVTTWALPEGAIARLGRGSVRDMAFSPDGQYFAVASEIGLWLYELPTLSPIALSDTERGMTDSVTFSPDNRRIATHTLVGNLKIWDIEHSVCTVEVDDHGRSYISNPVFLQDGQRITAVSYERNGKIYVWCAHTGTQLSETEIGETHGIHPFQFSADMRLLVGRRRETKSDPESILVWHVETGEQIRCFTGYPENMEKLCFSLDGRHLAAGSADGTIQVWDLESGQITTTYTDYGDVQIFPHYSPENGLIAAAVSDRNVEVWHIEAEKKIDTFQYRGNNRYRRACFSENGKQLAVAIESEIQIWIKGNNSDAHTLSTLHGHIPSMDTLAFSPDEKTFAAGFWGDNVLLWDVASKRSYRPHGEQLPGTSHNVYGSPNGKIISINSRGNNLNISEVGKSEPVAELIGPEGGLGRAEAYSPTGDRIARADKDDNIHIWERISTLNDTTENESWRKHPTVINDAEFIDGLKFSLNGLAFSPDGKRLASISRSTDSKACLWDVNSGRQITELHFTLPPERRSYHRGDNGIAFSPRGNIIAGGKWGEIVLWDATDGKTLMTLPQPQESQRPFTLCFAPCGQYLASGAWWQGGLQKVPIRLWEVATGKNIATFWGHTTDVQCFAFSQDGTLLVSGGHDGAIYLWDLKPHL